MKLILVDLCPVASDGGPTGVLVFLPLDARKSTQLSYFVGHERVLA